MLDGGEGADILTGGKGNDLFVFRAGQADGDVVTDFQGSGAVGGDMLKLVGFGAGTLTRVSSTDYYVITPDDAHGGSAAAETVHILNVTNVSQGDYEFMM